MLQIICDACRKPMDINDVFAIELAPSKWHVVQHYMPTYNREEVINATSHACSIECVKQSKGKANA